MSKLNNSPLISELIEALCSLPGVGPKSAQRMTYYLLQSRRKQGLRIAAALQQTMQSIINCRQCNNLAETPLCLICNNPARDRHTVCIVEMPGDIVAIEQSGVYKGLYYVLMGHLSPIDGIGPEQLGIDKLLQLVHTQAVSEIILALNATVEGEATSFYVSEILKTHPVKITQLAQGIPFGSELEYMDTSTIGRAIVARDNVTIKAN